MAKVLGYQDIPLEARKLLTDRGHEWVFCESRDMHEIMQAAKGCTGIVGRARQYTPAFFEALPELKILALPSAGYDQVDLAAASAHGVVVTNAAGGNAVSVAEQALLLMLMIARRVPEHTRVVHRQADWDTRPRGHELYGKTVSLIGYGGIAKELARMCMGIGMRVMAYHPRIAQREVQAGAIPCDDWSQAFSQADFVSLHLPYRPENDKLVGAGEFAMMKPSAYLINTGRGGVVDQQALIEALRQRRIAGAGLDVFTVEPIEPDNPLLTMDNCVCLPHSGGHTTEARARTLTMAVEQIARVLDGQQPTMQVNQL